MNYFVLGAEGRNEHFFIFNKMLSYIGERHPEAKGWSKTSHRNKGVRLLQKRCDSSVVSKTAIKKTIGTKLFMLNMLEREKEAAKVHEPSIHIPIILSNTIKLLQEASAGTPLVQHIQELKNGKSCIEWLIKNIHDKMKETYKFYQNDVHMFEDKGLRLSAEKRKSEVKLIACLQTELNNIKTQC